MYFVTFLYFAYSPDFSKYIFPICHVQPFVISFTGIVNILPHWREHKKQRSCEGAGLPISPSDVWRRLIIAMWSWEGHCMHYICIYVKDIEQIFEIMREQRDDSMYSIVTTRLQVCYIYTGLKSCYKIQTNKYIFANIFQCTPSVLTKCLWDSLWQRRSSGRCLSWWIGCCHSWTLSLPCAL